MRLLGISLLVFFTIGLSSCGGEEEKKNKKPEDQAKVKCEEVAKEIHGKKEGFKITASRGDKREVVKIALDEKYENQTKFIGSVVFEAEGKEDFCTCYLNEDLEIINMEMLKE